jgi:tetratricopeptide (TPR) repeat protein
VKSAWLLILLAGGGWDLSYRKNPEVVAGNEAFAAGNWDEAISHYQAAADALPDEPGVHFDLGAALLSKGEAAPAGKDRDEVLATASRELNMATDAPDARLRAGAHYNLGNLSYTKQDFGKAIDEYKRALKLDPKDENARHNLEMALREVEQKQQQQQQQQGDKKDQKDPKDQKDQQQQQQQQAKQDQDKKDQQQQDQQDQQQKDQAQVNAQRDQQDADKDKKDQQDSQANQNDPDMKDPKQGQGQQDQDKKDQKDQQQAQNGDQKDQKDQKDQQQQANAGKQQNDQRADDGDRKLDALERRSKDLQVAQHKAHADTRRHERPVKDW